MDSIYKMRNTIQPYAWGSRRMLAEFLNQTTPSAGPEAELWMGAHPKAPSLIQTAAGWENLDAIIRRSPDQFLGSEVRARFGRQLPFLFKVLAVGRPLSLQAHPDKQQAMEGYERENAQGIPLNAAQRNYRDKNHKPECICALTPFQALCGFREPDDALPLLEPLWPADLRAELEHLSRGWRPFYEFLVSRSVDWRRHVCRHAAERASSLADRAAVFEWVERLHRYYPGDIGILAPVLLNLVHLSPGEALFLPAGQLHAYLHGMAVEIMANSDNVLRGGLTSKHIDGAELIRILEFRSLAVHTLALRSDGPAEQTYLSPADEFRLSRIRVEGSGEMAVTSRGPEILLCSQGNLRIRGAEERGIELGRGESVFIPAASDRYWLSGRAELFRATVNFEEIQRLH